MLIDAGSRDQRPIQALADYGLIYCGESLPEDLTIAGEVRVTLSVQSNCPDTDFVAKLIDLHPDGSAMLLMDGVIRAMYRDPPGEPHHLVPDRVERLTINLGHICHTIGAGHRIEVALVDQPAVFYSPRAWVEDREAYIPRDWPVQQPLQLDGFQLRERPA